MLRARAKYLKGSLPGELLLSEILAEKKCIKSLWPPVLMQESTELRLSEFTIAYGTKKLKFMVYLETFSFNTE